jgi:hypothetical protein
MDPEHARSRGMLAASPLPSSIWRYGTFAPPSVLLRVKAPATWHASPHFGALALSGSGCIARLALRASWSAASRLLGGFQ